MNIVKLLKDELSGFTGHAAVYELFPPFIEGRRKCQFVVVSATNVFPGLSEPETYIFQSTKTGKVKKWGELEGSYKGGLSHSKALEGMGYKIQS